MIFAGNVTDCAKIRDILPKIFTKLEEKRMKLVDIWRELRGNGVRMRRNAYIFYAENVKMRKIQRP